MQASQLKPASQCAKQYGVKALAHGGPGSGKTPLIMTAPSPVICATEPGLLSLRDSNIPTWEAYTPAAIDEFMLWVTTSQEANQFDTICIDSVSQMAETYLEFELKNNKHGLKAYGVMAEKVMPHMRALYHLQRKHVYLIAKQHTTDEGGGMLKKRPYFPGKELNVKVPHLYDEILCVGKYQMPNIQGEQRAIRTLDSLTVSARDRSGQLNEYEQCNLAELFAKCMS